MYDTYRIRDVQQQTAFSLAVDELFVKKPAITYQQFDEQIYSPFCGDATINLANVVGSLTTSLLWSCSAKFLITSANTGDDLTMTEQNLNENWSSSYSGGEAIRASVSIAYNYSVTTIFAQSISVEFTTSQPGYGSLPAPTYSPAYVQFA